jgi:hypothetical protein
MSAAIVLLPWCLSTRDVAALDLVHRQDLRADTGIVTLLDL